MSSPTKTATTTTVHSVSRAEQSVRSFSDVIKQNDAVVWVGLVSQRQRYTAAAHWRLLCWRTGHCRTVSWCFSFRAAHYRTVNWRLSFRTRHNRTVRTGHCRTVCWRLCFRTGHRCRCSRSWHSRTRWSVSAACMYYSKLTYVS